MFISLKHVCRLRKWPIIWKSNHGLKNVGDCENYSRVQRIYWLIWKHVHVFKECLRVPQNIPRIENMVDDQENGLEYGKKITSSIIVHKFKTMLVNMKKCTWVPKHIHEFKKVFIEIYKIMRLIKMIMDSENAREFFLQVKKILANMKNCSRVQKIFKGSKNVTK